MKKSIRRLLIAWLCSMMIFPSMVSEGAKPEMSEKRKAKSEIEIQASSGILMELSTGEVLFEKNAHAAMPPASVTKIMTMLLIFEALEEGSIKAEDQVCVSEYAASMGGSQVFFEPGELQTVDTMLKCIAVASANDACVAMAEYIAGNEEAFVQRMNQRAKALGMKNTNFVNCNGLDTDGHKMSATDIALMTKELITKHPQIHKYCTIWMEDITHTTAKGKSAFGLSNTNKLLRQYPYCTGLKTGSTANAGFCISATAEKDGMKLIAVIMNGETSKTRFVDAVTLLQYGFENFRVYKDASKREPLPALPVLNGVQEQVEVDYHEEFFCLLNKGEHPGEIEKRRQIPKELKAPVQKGEVVGKIEYFYREKKLGTCDVVAKEAVKQAKYWDYVKKVYLAWMM